MKKIKPQMQAIIILVGVMLGISAIGVSNQLLEKEPISSAYAIVKKKPEPVTEPASNIEKVMAIAKEKGLSDTETARMIAIIACESRFDQYAIGDNGQSLGIAQFHIPSNPNMAKKCMFSIECSINKMIDLYQEDGHFGRWTCSKLIK